MTSTLREVAESRFAALTRREKAVISDVEAERLATQEKTARLKSLRLARDAQSVSDRVTKLKRRRATISAT